MRTKATKASTVRKPLSTLETNRIDKENVGLGSSSTGKEGIIKSITKEKHHSPITDACEIIETKNVQSTLSQTDVESRFDENDLISTDNPSEGYWKMLAEQRLKALEKTLKENEELHCKIEALEKQKRAYREMLDETTALVNVLQEMIGQDDGNSSAEDNLN